MPVYNTPQRPRTREDGWPTRADIRYDSDAERMCRVLVGLVEDMGASESLTRAVTLLSKARDAIADHVERIAPAPVVQPVPPTEPGERRTCQHGETYPHDATVSDRNYHPVSFWCPGPVPVAPEEGK